jgi:hypothetical protein
VSRGFDQSGSAEIKKNAPPESLSKTRIFEKTRQDRKASTKSGLNLSQNTFLISTSQKIKVRVSFERVYDDQTEKNRSYSRAGESAISYRGEGRRAIIRCGRLYVETDANRLCPRLDRRPEPCPAA